MFVANRPEGRTFTSSMIEVKRTFDKLLRNQDLAVHLYDRSPGTPVKKTDNHWDPESPIKDKGKLGGKVKVEKR